MTGTGHDDERPASPDDGPDDDPIDVLLARVLESAESGDADASSHALEEACAAHPHLADTLRRRAALLRELGVLAPPVSGPPDDDPTEPAQLGAFRLLRPLGAGGMGVVHLAEQSGLGRRVAVKIIRPEHLYFPGARERFRREVETVARLQHPGIVPIYTVGEERGVPYFAMEFVEGCSLADALHDLRARGSDVVQLEGRHLAEAVARCAAGDAAGSDTLGDDGSGTAPDASDSWLYAGSWEAACLRIVRLAAEALEHAHRRGVVHRDIKPSNIMLTHGETGGQVKLLDFGLASSGAPGDGSITRSGSRVGSLHYMAPEQARGDVASVDARTDVYGLGATLYELLTLRRPFEGRNEAQVLAAIERGDATPVRILNRATSWEAETACMTAMEPDRARRYASAADLARDLDNVARRLPLEARRAGTVLRARRWVQRSPMAVTALGLSLLLLVGVPLLFLARERETSAAIRAQLERADASFARSLDAIDRMLTRVGAEDLAFVPQMEPLRVALLEDAVELTEGALAEQRDDDGARSRAAAGNERLGRLLVQLGRLDEGFAVLRRSLDLHDELVALAPDPEPARAERADVLGALAEGLGRAGRIDEAEAAHREADAVFAAAVARHPDAPELRRRRATNLTSLGELLTSRRDREVEASYTPATEAWEQAIALDERLALETPDDASVHAALGEVRTALAEHLLQRPLGRAARMREHELLDAADASYARAVELAPDDPSLALRRLVAQLVRANAFKAEGRFADAEPVVRAVIPGLEDLVRRFPSTPAYEIELATALNELGSLFDWRNEHASAAEWYGRAVTELRDLATRYPFLADLQSRAGQGEMNLGAQLLRLRRPAEAADHFARAITDQQRAIALAPSHTAYPDQLRWHFMALSDALLALGRLADAAGAADAIAGVLPDDWESHTRAGSQIAKVISAAPDADASLTEDLAERAVAHLHRALELGFPYAPELRTIAVLAPLRGRTSFEALLEEFDVP